MSVPEITSTRNLTIDLVKIVAMSMVVCLHTTHNFIFTEGRVLAEILYNLSVTAIPLFFMVSGYLLLGRKNVTWRYPLHKIFAIVRFVFIVAVVYWLYDSIFHESCEFKFQTLIDLFWGAFTNENRLQIFWFLSSLAMIYVVYPLINRLYSHPRAYAGVLVAVLLVQCTVFYLNLTIGFEFHVRQVLRLWNWFAYFMLGGVVKKIKVGRVVSASVYVVSAIISLICILRWQIRMGTTYCEFFYSFPMVVVMTVSLFVFICSFHFEDNRFIKSFSTLFLPVYTLHIFIAKHMTSVMDTLAGYWFGSAVFFLIVLIVTSAVSWLLMKVPGMKTIFKI